MKEKPYLQKDLIVALNSLVRVIYIVCEEEDEVLRDIYTFLKEGVKKRATLDKVTDIELDNYFKVHTSFGLIPFNLLLRSWTDPSNTMLVPSETTISTLGAITSITAETPLQQTLPSYYFLVDPERWFNDTITMRRVLHLQHICQNNDFSNKVLVFIGPQIHIPAKLNPYLQVIKYEKPSKRKMSSLLETTKSALNLKSIITEGEDVDVLNSLSGLTVAEAGTAIRRSISLTRAKSEDGSDTRFKVTPGNVTDFKMERLKKTNLLTLINTSSNTFAHVGGLDRFKQYAERVKGSWTPEGQAFGLKPPKGILCVGVWGCGKSLSVKSLGAEWKLPTIQLEIGKLRSSAVGETEANLYKALSYIEAMAPCLVWVDEADKSLSGVQSSGKSDSGTTARTIGILSTWYQETKSPICMVFTANNISSIPVEIINRVDDRFFFDVPSIGDLVEVLKIQLRLCGHISDSILQGWDLMALATASKGLVPREVEQAINQALRESFYQKKPHLDFQLLKSELASKPRILDTMEDEVKELQTWVGYDSVRDEGVRAKFAASRAKKGLSVLK